MATSFRICHGSSASGSPALLVGCLSSGFFSSFPRQVIPKRLELIRRGNAAQTTYLREAVTTKIEPHGKEATNGDSMEKTLRNTESPDIESISRDDSPSQSPPTFISQLKVYNGTYSEQNVWKIFLRPLPFVLSPVVRLAVYEH